jgi:tetratricopeptide (TPR) repeat protein
MKQEIATQKMCANQTKAHERGSQSGRYCCHLNNHAAGLIRDGKFEIAIVILTKALRCARNIMSNCDGKVHQRIPKEETTLDSCMVRTRPETDDKSHSEMDIDKQDSGYYIYRTPMQVPSTMKSSSYEEQVILSVTIMFNLALAHHLSFLDEGFEHPRSRIRKAIKLYEYAYTMQRDERLISNAFFTMATLNNVGQIYQTMKASDLAEKCFQQLLATLMFVVDCGEGRGTFSGLEGFFQNTTHLVLHLGPAAAA